MPKRLFRLVAVILAGCLMAATAGAEAPGKSIVVLGAPLVLKNEKMTAVQYLGEYIPDNETFDGFTKMFAVWGRLDGSDAQAQVNAKIQFVNSRKGADPLSNYSAFQSNDKKTFGLDFLISEGGVMEQNVWSFQNVKGGVLAYQYVRRHYEGKSAQSGADFIKEVPSVRNQVLSFFKTAQLPRPQGYQ